LSNRGTTQYSRDVTTEEKIACARVVAAVILADAAITDAEHAFLEKVFADLALTPEERKAATAGLSVGDGPGDAVSHLKDEAVKIEALKLAAAAMSVDGEDAKVERRIVDEVAKALALPAEVAAEALRLGTLPKP
jgi:hypothetical protein